jgi:hypothetical protein
LAQMFKKDVDGADRVKKAQIMAEVVQEEA